MRHTAISIVAAVASAAGTVVSAHAETINVYDAHGGSVVSRYRESASVCLADADGKCDSAVYQPLNLSPLFASDGTLADGIPVVD